MPQSLDDLAAERAAREIMERFARRTGLSPDGPQRRYLWTDAFAVDNWLTLLVRTGDRRFAELARSLVQRVHHVLGRLQPAAQATPAWGAHEDINDVMLATALAPDEHVRV